MNSTAKYSCVRRIQMQTEKRLKLTLNCLGLWSKGWDSLFVLLSFFSERHKWYIRLTWNKTSRVKNKNHANAPLSVMTVTNSLCILTISSQMSSTLKHLQPPRLLKGTTAKKQSTIREVHRSCCESTWFMWMPLLIAFAGGMQWEPTVSICRSAYCKALKTHCKVSPIQSSFALRQSHQLNLSITRVICRRPEGVWPI